MKIFFIIISNILLLINICFADPEAEKIVANVDNNMYSTTAQFDADMTITYKDRTEKKKYKITAQGKEKSFSEFIEPAKDKGLKFLRVDKKLWMYVPDVEKVIVLSGHQLRQSAVGSDMSYEDMLERSKKLIEYYNCEMKEKNNDTVVIELTAKDKNVTYYKRILVIDIHKMIPIREEYYAKSGKLIKSIENIEIKQFNQKRWYPTHIILRDHIRNISTTEVRFLNSQFDIKLPDDAFSQSRLK